MIGDGRTYEYVVALRSVSTTDFMTAHWSELPHSLLGKVSNRIINEYAVSIASSTTSRVSRQQQSSGSNRVPERGLFGEVPPPKPRSRSDSSASQARHTWFFALRPCAEDAQRIQAYAERLLAAHGISGKRIAPERLHITLDLVGHDVDETAVTRACRAAESVRFHPIEARFDAAMTFSAPSGPFVLLGGEGLNDVRAFRLLLGRTMAEQGFAPPLSYEPHMTLCYDPRHRAARTAVESIGFRTAEFALVKSHIGLSRHEIIQTWSMDAPPA